MRYFNKVKVGFVEKTGSFPSCLYGSHDSHPHVCTPNPSADDGFHLHQCELNSPVLQRFFSLLCTLTMCFLQPVFSAFSTLLGCGLRDVRISWCNTRSIKLCLAMAGKVQSPEAGAQNSDLNELILYIINPIFYIDLQLY